MQSEQTSMNSACVDVCDAANQSQRSAPRRRGQGLVEYVLIILFVALAVVLALSLLAPVINSIFRSLPSVL
jgi:Flp pilus assembly pilin Flp